MHMKYRLCRAGQAASTVLQTSWPDGLRATVLSPPSFGHKHAEAHEYKSACTRQDSTNTNANNARAGCSHPWSSALLQRTPSGRHARHCHSVAAPAAGCASTAWRPLRRSARSYRAGAGATRPRRRGPARACGDSQPAGSGACRRPGARHTYVFVHHGRAVMVEEQAEGPCVHGLLNSSCAPPCGLLCVAGVGCMRALPVVMLSPDASKPLLRGLRMKVSGVSGSQGFKAQRIPARASRLCHPAHAHAPVCLRCVARASWMPVPEGPQHTQACMCIEHGSGLCLRQGHD